MVNYDEMFNTTGKFPTNPDFWIGSRDEYVTSEGITSGFSKILGEQVYRPVSAVETPMYSRFAGRPLIGGNAYRERAVYKINARHFKPKATASDDLDFVDNEGCEFVYNVDSAGWIKTSIPSELENIEMNFDRYEVGELNSILVDNVIKSYQNSVESAIGKKLVSNIKASEDIDFTDGQQAVKDINKLAIRMRGTQYHYNQLTEAQNAKLITKSDRIYCFIDAETLENMRESFASLPSPDRISENVEFVPIYDGMPTPLTTAEYTAGPGEDAGGTTIVWDGEPIAIDEDKPIAMLVSDRICEYRPVINSYRMTMKRNEAGDFQNVHLKWKSLCLVRPFENGIRLNQSA